MAYDFLKSKLLRECDLPDSTAEQICAFISDHAHEIYKEREDQKKCSRNFFYIVL